MSETGRSPAIPTAELETMGYKLVIFPSTQTWVFAKAYEELCQAVLRDRTTASLADRFTSFDDVNALLGLAEWQSRMSARDVYDARGFGGRQGAGERPAVVVVDFIEGFTNPESALACDADAAVEATRSLLDAARAASVPVFFTTVAYGEGDLERAAMFIAKAPALATLRPGSPWVEVDARLGRRPEEPVLVKLFASAFFGTNLDELLRDAGLRHGRSSPVRRRRDACARRPSTRSSTATASSCRARPWPTGRSTPTTARCSTSTRSTAT